MGFEQAKGFFALLVIINRNVRLNLTKNKGLLDERNELSGFDIELKLREGLFERGLIKECVCGVREITLLQILVDENIELV